LNTAAQQRRRLSGAANPNRLATPGVTIRGSAPCPQVVPFIGPKRAFPTLCDETAHQKALRRETNVS